MLMTSQLVWRVSTLLLAFYLFNHYYYYYYYYYYYHNYYCFAFLTHTHTRDSKDASSSCCVSSQSRVCAGIFPALFKLETICQQALYKLKIYLFPTAQASRNLKIGSWIQRRMATSSVVSSIIAARRSRHWVSRILDFLTSG